MNSFCTAWSDREANNRVAEFFARIAANKVMEASESDFDVALSYPGPDGSTIRLPFLPHLPDYFRSFVEQAHAELSDVVGRTISILRWRTNQLGVHNPLSWRGLRWSFDGVFWHPAPSRTGSVGLHVSHALRPSLELRGYVARSVGDGETGPLYHDLFREAWQQRVTNRRSAVVIAMAAAELSVKRIVSLLIPDAEWLAMHLPTPPLIRMLTEYLPRLPARLKIGGEVKPPPKAVVEALRKGVNIRNEMAHAGGKGPSLDNVGEILDAVHDLLWLVDYYSGHDWALEHLRRETRESLVSAS